MKLTAQDEAWLGEYRELLEREFPGLVQRIILFGSKAKGMAGADSDIDLVVIISGATAEPSGSWPWLAMTWR